MTVKKIRNIIYLVIALMTLASCSEYQAILKNRDTNLWYVKGMEYYAAGDYIRASNLLGGVMSSYTGTSRGDTILMAYANCLARLGDYYSAAGYFQNYVKTYPSSDNCEECQFMSGYCYYKLSPKTLLDQQDTQNSIDEFQTFINLYPGSSKVPEAERMMREMENKLAYKEYLNAKLYFDLGDYMGNNYLSAVIVAQNCLRKYPDTQYREELSFLILEAKYIQAERSVVRKQSDRYRDAIDEYYAFVNEYPESKYIRKANNILQSSEKGLKRAEQIAPPDEDDLEYYRNYGNQVDRKIYEELKINE